MAGEPRLLYGPDASILITGASSGIGAAIALHLANYGGKIALFARREDRLHEVAERVRAAGARPLVLVGDVADPEGVQQAHEQLVAEQGAVDVAFLNAGMGHSLPAAEFDAADIRRVFAVNLFGVVNWIEPLLPLMLQREHGIVVGLSSLARSRGYPTMGAYCASKAALSVMLESLRVEARTRGVQVTTVEPGFVRSELTDKNLFPMPFMVETPEAAATICEAVAAGRTLIRFPWVMSAGASMARAVPRPLYERLATLFLKRVGTDTLKEP